MNFLVSNFFSKNVFDKSHSAEMSTGHSMLAKRRFCLRLKEGNSVVSKNLEKWHSTEKKTKMGPFGLSSTFASINYDFSKKKVSVPKHAKEGTLWALYYPVGCRKLKYPKRDPLAALKSSGGGCEFHNAKKT